MQKLTEGLMKKMLKSAVAGETILYTCYHETSLKRAMKLAYKVINKFGYKYHHPSASPVGFDGVCGNVFNFEGGGWLALVARSQEGDKPMYEIMR